MLRNVVAVLILQLDQSAVLLLVRIDATQRPNNDAVECALEDFRVDDGACNRVCENVSGELFDATHLVATIEHSQLECNSLR